MTSLRERHCGIYCIENMVNGHKYVGKSIDIHNRWRGHINCLKKEDERYERNTYFIKAFNHYGEENFKFYILEECLPEELNQKEMYYIKEMNTKVPNGYNLTDGGEGVLGYTHNEERRKKISENTPKMKGENHPCFGKHWDDEAKLNLHNKNSREKCAVFGTKHPDSASKYHGVSINHHKQEKYGKIYETLYWVAKLRVDKKEIHLGYFKIEEDAARAYDKYVFENGLKNILNFPEEYLDMT